MVTSMSKRERRELILGAAILLMHAARIIIVPSVAVGVFWFGGRNPVASCLWAAGAWIALGVLAELADRCLHKVEKD
jgi:hypothetical protein